MSDMIQAAVSEPLTSSDVQLPEKQAETNPLPQNVQDFVPADVEQILSTGILESSSQSMDDLRDRVNKAREQAGAPRPQLPPGFDPAQDLQLENQIQQQVDSAKRKALEQQQPNGPVKKGKTEQDQDQPQNIAPDQNQQIQKEIEPIGESKDPEARSILKQAFSSLSELISRKPKQESTTNDLNKAVASESNPPDPDADANSSESCSDSESDSSSDDSDEEGDARNVVLALGADDDNEQYGDDDDDDLGTSGGAAPATKNEIVAPQVEQPLIQQLSSDDLASIRLLGKVHSIIDSVVVIEQDVYTESSSASQPQPTDTKGKAKANDRPPLNRTARQGEKQDEHSVLETASLVCFDDGNVLGLVFETFGSIHSPMYSVRFGSASLIDESIVQLQRPVYYLPRCSTYVMTKLLKSSKGSDASNIWDEEVAEDEIEYSDDEAEADAKRRAKAIKSGKVDQDGNPISFRPGGKANHPKGQASFTRDSNRNSRSGGNPNANANATNARMNKVYLPSKPPSSLPAKPTFVYDAPNVDGAVITAQPNQRRILSYDDLGSAAGDETGSFAPTPGRNGHQPLPPSQSHSQPQSQSQPQLQSYPQSYSQPQFQPYSHYQQHQPPQRMANATRGRPTAGHYSLPLKPASSSTTTSPHLSQGTMSNSSSPQLLQSPSGFALSPQTDSSMFSYPTYPPAQYFSSPSTPAATGAASGYSETPTTSLAGGGHYNPRFAGYWQPTQSQPQPQPQSQSHEQGQGQGQMQWSSTAAVGSASSGYPTTATNSAAVYYPSTGYYPPNPAAYSGYPQGYPSSDPSSYSSMYGYGYVEGYPVMPSTVPSHPHPHPHPQAQAAAATATATATATNNGETNATSSYDPKRPSMTGGNDS